MESGAFSTVEARRQNREKFDEKIAGWTKNYENRELMAILQSKGIPAGAVLDAEEMHRDPQLMHRKHF